MIKVKDYPLNEILFLGSHDSSSFIMNFNDTPILKSEPFNIRKLKFIPTLEKTVKDWSLTQSNNFYTQCINGIRVFDLRCSTPKSEMNEFWLEHSYATVKLSECLEQLYQFCLENPSEILIIFFRVDDYPFLLQKELLEIWKPYFKIMFNHRDFKTNEIVSNLLKNSIQWLVYGNVDLNTLSNFFGDYNVNIDDPWINTDDPIIKKEGLEFELKEMNLKKDREKFYSLSWTLTPQLQSDVLPSIFRNLLCCNNDYCCGGKHSLKKLAKEFNLTFESFAKDNMINIKNKVNIIWIDFPKTNQYFYSILLNQ